MRKIDKGRSRILATVYKEWLEELEKNNKTHPHTDTYYVDVLMNLLHCQNGVCAYTEELLCEPELLGRKNWQKGRYKEKQPERLGEIDHFDPKLKKELYWQWENLFVVLERINRLKGKKAVDGMFKPDSPGYDPGKYLEYDVETHRFRPHGDIKDKGLKKSVERMLKILNINYGPIHHKRRSYLNKVKLHQRVDEPITIDRFFTACRMAGLSVEE